MCSQKVEHTGVSDSCSEQCKVPHNDASIAKLFLDLATRDEYDEEIPLEDKVVTLTEWFDNLPDKLADEIIAKANAMAEAPDSWRPYVCAKE